MTTTNRSERISIRVTPEEKTAIQKAARADGRKVSDWVARAATEAARKVRRK